MPPQREEEKVDHVEPAQQTPAQQTPAQKIFQDFWYSLYRGIPTHPHLACRKIAISARRSIRIAFDKTYPCALLAWSDKACTVDMFQQDLDTSLFRIADSGLYQNLGWIYTPILALPCGRDKYGKRVMVRFRMIRGLQSMVGVEQDSRVDWTELWGDLTEAPAIWSDSNAEPL
ncbi:uncharacterized protein E0L32_006790 [Thyridium curvatum]|uniref:Uncharacterized protein n=1 Tax=Thyridium curvatum TaxID=1093900 RepID=A0A507B8F0_9PEZI|nr:uncharacterized protein E0L32_006790 [Thyridium curvatum]TPX12910.1 hypothetical protein E0L32_006790 [Thyridium curvatum]